MNSNVDWVQFREEVNFGPQTKRETWEIMDLQPFKIHRRRSMPFLEYDSPPRVDYDDEDAFSAFSGSDVDTLDSLRSESISSLTSASRERSLDY